MTPEEAVALLQAERAAYYHVNTKLAQQWMDALSLAIAALEKKTQPPPETKE